MPRISDLSTPSARLQDGLEKLIARWQETNESWNDENSRNLQQEYLEPLAKHVSGALSATNHLSDVLEKAQRECEAW